MQFPVTWCWCGAVVSLSVHAMSTGWVHPCRPSHSWQAEVLQAELQRLRGSRPAAGVPLASLAVPVHAPFAPPQAPPAAAGLAPASPDAPAGKHCAICLDAKHEPACGPCGCASINLRAFGAASD